MRTRDVYPGFEFFPSRTRIKNLSILAQKMVSKLLEIWSGLFISDPDPDFLPIPDPGYKGQKGTVSRIRNTVDFIEPYYAYCKYY